MFRDLLLLVLAFFIVLLFSPFSARSTDPFVLRISCGARDNVHMLPSNVFWFKDFGYTGGIAANATPPSHITPPLKTLRYFPLSEGPENCYNLSHIVRKGHYYVRIFFGLVAEPNFDNEPLFDVSVEGTQIWSLKPGWTSHDEQVFAEALVFLNDHSASICFHSTGHGDPGILSIEVSQMDNNAYYFGPQSGQGTILRTAKRLSCGAEKPMFDEDYRGDLWGGDRFWEPIGQSSDRILSVNDSIKQASSASPNDYREALYKKALISTDDKPDLEYTMDVDPNRNYSVWLHFAEIDKSVTRAGQRIFDIMINGDTKFRDIDIVKMSGDILTALVLNTTVYVDGKFMTVTVHPSKGNHAIINALEIFEVIAAESKTLMDEVRALQKLKNALGLLSRLGWNGDPCVPQQHPWSGVHCQFDKLSSKWVIDGLDLNNQSLRGFLPDDISELHHLQSINLSGNSIHGPIPSSLGTVTSLKILDLSYNFFNGSIPESLGQLTSLQRLNLNGNSLSGRVPAALGGLLHRASFNFTDNPGLSGLPTRGPHLSGIPGLPTRGPHLSARAKIGIEIGIFVAFCLIGTCLSCWWWKRRQNILRAQGIPGPIFPRFRRSVDYSYWILLTVVETVVILTMACYFYTSYGTL